MTREKGLERGAESSMPRRPQPARTAGTSGARGLHEQLLLAELVLAPGRCGAAEAAREPARKGGRFREAEQFREIFQRALRIAQVLDGEVAPGAVEDVREGLSILLQMAVQGAAIESEMLIKAGRLGARVAHVRVRTIYNGCGSHFRPVTDTFRISCASVYFKVFDDGDGAS